MPDVGTEIVRRGLRLLPRPNRCQCDEIVKCDAQHIELVAGIPERGKIGVPYNAANFTCDTGTYTVPSGSLSIYNYSLSGTRLKITIFASNGSIAGSPTVLIHGGWPFQFANYDFATGFVTTTSPTALAPSRMYGNPNASTIAMFYPAGGFTANNGATIIQAGGWFTVN